MPARHSQHTKNSPVKHANSFRANQVRVRVYRSNRGLHLDEEDLLSSQHYVTLPVLKKQHLEISQHITQWRRAQNVCVFVFVSCVCQGLYLWQEGRYSRKQRCIKYVTIQPYNLCGYDDNNRNTIAKVIVLGVKCFVMAEVVYLSLPQQTLGDLIPAPLGGISRTT